ncbi:MAG: DUF4402 domain-containing protein [Desulfobacter sp.]|nr:DUF4402 domain-containing protein [Desulfobacter sp.]
MLSVQPLYFGNIVNAPSGDQIEIDASTGPALPNVYGGGNSFINGGHSGLIRVFSDTPGETITLIFPASVGVRGASASHTIDQFTLRSTASPVVSSGVGILDFHIGALLHINSGQPDNNYNFDINITIQFDNP